jgi:hypothetical protein
MNELLQVSACNRKRSREEEEGDETLRGFMELGNKLELQLKEFVDQAVRKDMDPFRRRTVRKVRAMSWSLGNLQRLYETQRRADRQHLHVLEATLADLKDTVHALWLSRSLGDPSRSDTRPARSLGEEE